MLEYSGGGAALSFYLLPTVLMCAYHTCDDFIDVLMFSNALADINKSLTLVNFDHSVIEYYINVHLTTWRLLLI